MSPSLKLTRLWSLSADRLQVLELIINKKGNPNDPPKAGFVVAIKKTSGGPIAVEGNARDEENCFIETQSLIDDHENLIKMIYSFRREDEYFFVLLLAEGSDLISLWGILDDER